MSIEHACRPNTAAVARRRRVAKPLLAVACVSTLQTQEASCEKHALQ